MDGLGTGCAAEDISDCEAADVLLMKIPREEREGGGKKNMQPDTTETMVGALLRQSTASKNITAESRGHL